MDEPYDIKENLSRNGFAIIGNIFIHEEIDKLHLSILQARTEFPHFVLDC